jgi:hypothetical protein
MSFLRHVDYTALHLKRKKLVSVRASNHIHMMQLASSAFMYPDRVTENIIFRLYKISRGYLGAKYFYRELLFAFKVHICIARLQKVTGRTLCTAFCITV